MTDVNPVLKRVMKLIHESRHPLSIDPKTVVRHEISDQHKMCEVWFMTEGCSYDRDGGCTMCNYGKGHIVDENEILTQLQRAFRSLPNERFNLIVNPSGSFLDKQEVSLSLREGIYNILDGILFDSLTIENRADILEKSSLECLRDRFPKSKVSIEIGVETFNPWLLRNSINKGVTPEQIINAVKLVHSAGLTAVANIGLGLPFINERKNISVAVDSIKAAFDNGFDAVILFPYHVKPGTLLEFLYHNCEYRCISLWSLVAVLSQIPEMYLDKVNISWYKNYYTDKSKIISSPTTCPICEDAVLELLDKYKATPSNTSLQVLNDFSCDCRVKWSNSMLEQRDEIDFEFVAKQYQEIAGCYNVRLELLEHTLKEMEDALYVNN